MLFRPTGFHVLPQGLKPRASKGFQGFHLVSFWYPFGFLLVFLWFFRVPSKPDTPIFGPSNPPQRGKKGGRGEKNALKRKRAPRPRAERRRGGAGAQRRSPAGSASRGRCGGHSPRGACICLFCCVLFSVFFLGGEHWADLVFPGFMKPHRRF